MRCAVALVLLLAQFMLHVMIWRSFSNFDYVPQNTIRDPEDSTKTYPCFNPEDTSSFSDLDKHG